MKKKGFTLIELLAVIVIMGILMFAAIPAINRTIENARKDQFVNLAQNYAKAAKTLWDSDGLECTTDGGTTWAVASALPNGDYFIRIDTANGSDVELLQQGGKSPWGNRDVVGYVEMNKNPNAVWIYPVLYDSVYSVNGGFMSWDGLVRSDVAKADSAPNEYGDDYMQQNRCREV